MVNIRFNLLNTENDGKLWDILTGKPTKEHTATTRYQNQSICRAVFDSRGEYLGMQQLKYKDAATDSPERFWEDGIPS